MRRKPQYLKHWVRSKMRKMFKKRFRFFSYSDLDQANPNATLINTLITELHISGVYLEIGVEHGVTLDGVRMKKKIGVDPNPLFYNLALPFRSKVFRATSDEFFSKLSRKKTFSLIYIDGLHVFSQVWKDLINSFSCLEKNGIVLLDDTVPSDEFSALPSFEECISSRKLHTGIDSAIWHGDVFKVIHVLSSEFSEFFEWFTLRDAWNPKTIIRPVGGTIVAREVLKKLEGVDLEKYQSLEYKVFFQNGTPPEYFNAVDTAEAIKLLKSRHHG